jgi:AcrR family transcriptional regulator
MPSTRPARRGRPAGPAADTRETVLRAALDLLLAEGVGALTPQRLHEESGVARSTLYRHWPTPDDVVDDLLLVAAQTEHPVPTGDVVADLEAALDALLWRLRHRPVAPFLAALMSGPPDDAALVARRSRYVDTLLEPFHAALRSSTAPVPAAERDELVSLVAGPVLLTWLATGRPPTRTKARAGLAAALPRLTGA